MSVVTLPRLAEGPAPQENVVELIEDMLAKAKKGEVQSFAACLVDAGGYVSTAYAKGALPQNHHLTAGAVYLLERLQREAS